MIARIPRNVADNVLILQHRLASGKYQSTFTRFVKILHITLRSSHTKTGHVRRDPRHASKARTQEMDCRWSAAANILAKWGVP